MWQQTLAQPLTFSGIGLHSGRPVKVTIYPAAANHGLRFVRADLPGQPEIQAHYSKVVDTLRATTLGEGRATLSTVEHLLAALLGAGVDNARIAVEGPEVPIMDGSAGPFAVLLAATGFKTLPWLRAYLRVHRPVELREGDQWMRVVPGEPRITYTIDFSHPLIKRQRFTVPLVSEAFAREIASARTFGFLKEVQYLQTNGLALGGSLDNAVVLDDAGVMNPGGFRFPDECVRHKILDAVGDLALLGSAPVWPPGSEPGQPRIPSAVFAAPDGARGGLARLGAVALHPGKTSRLVSTHPVGGGDRLRFLTCGYGGEGRPRGLPFFCGERAFSGQLSAFRQKTVRFFDWRSFCPAFEVSVGPYPQAWRGVVLWIWTELRQNTGKMPGSRMLEFSTRSL